MTQPRQSSDGVRWGRALLAVVVAVAATIAASLVVAPPPAGAQNEPAPETVALAFESQVDDVSTDELTVFSLATLGDPRGWIRSGFTFSSDDASEYKVILAEPDVVDLLCAPIQTDGSLSCQNGAVVMLNAERWRSAVDGWTDVNSFRQYLLNHEVGHLIGQFHPANRCPVAGEPESLMAPQSLGLEGCQPNAWPLDFETLIASVRPVALAPAPGVEPEARAINPGGQVPPTTAAGGATTTAAADTTAPGTTAETPADDPATDQSTLPPADNDEGETVATLGDTPLSTPAGAQTLEDADLSSVGERSPNDSNTSLPLAVLLAAVVVAVIVGLVALVRSRRRRKPVVIPADDRADALEDLGLAEPDPNPDDSTLEGQVILGAAAGTSTADDADAEPSRSGELERDHPDDGDSADGDSADDAPDASAHPATDSVPVVAAAAAFGAAASAGSGAHAGQDPSPYPEDDATASVPATPTAPTPAWSVTTAGGARQVGSIAWLVPRRWAGEDAELFETTIAALDTGQTSASPDPAQVGEVLGGFLRAHPHLAPGDDEAIGVTMVGDGEVVAAALGAAEVIELRSGLAKPARRQGVVRLRHHDSSPLEVELSVAASVPQRARITIERDAPQES